MSDPGAPAAAVAVAALLGAAVLLLLPRSRGRLPAGPDPGPGPGRTGLRSPRASTALVGAAGAGASGLVLRGPVLLLALVGIGAALGGADLIRRQRAERVARSAALRATEFCEALAADLVAGGAPSHVLAAAAVDFPEFEPVCAAERLGADVPDALRRLAERPGLSDLRLVAGAWHVSYRSGSGLAESLDRVARTLRARRRTGRLVAAELAAAYATARIMAALPLVFVLVGSGLGADPVGFLTGGAGGVACLGSGLLLTWAGLAWLQRIGQGVATR